MDDYALIVADDEDRPTVRWVGRMVGYCWPHIADLERAE